MKKSRLGRLVVKAEESKKDNKVKKEKPVYTEISNPKELIIADGVKLVFSVNKSQEGNTHIDIRTYIESEKYTGPTKKGINFHIESLEDFIEIISDMNEELEGLGI